MSRIKCYANENKTSDFPCADTSIHIYMGGMVTAPAKGARLSLSLWCPFSGVVIAGRQVRPHQIPLLVCAGGTLQIWCAEHGTRCFVGDRGIIEIIMRQAHEVKPPAPVRAARSRRRNEEGNDGEA